MRISEIVNRINEKLAGETLLYSQLEVFLDEVVDDINAKLNSKFPAFSTVYTTDALKNDVGYDYFPEKYIRTVVVIGAAYKYFCTDEEGLPTAQQYAFDYNTNLFVMERDYSALVPEEYRESGQGYLNGPDLSSVLKQFSNNEEGQYLYVGTDPVYVAIQGFIGPQGPKGDTGPQGPTGPSGAAFSYEDFTPAQLEALRGPQGPQGQKGPQGPKGGLGPKGPAGPQGPVGPKGPKGEKGDKGDTGEAGYTPQKGVDYLLESDKIEIVEMAKDSMQPIIDSKVDKAIITTEVCSSSTDNEIPTAKAAFTFAEGIGYWLYPMVVESENNTRDNQERINKIKYYGNPDIEITPDSYFTFSEDGKTLLSFVNDETNPITEVVIPYHVEVIGTNAFKDNLDIIKVVFPNTVTEIGNYSFGGCTNLETVVLPNSLKRIRGMAFYRCSALSSPLYIPSSIKSLGDNFVSYCNALTEIYIAAHTVDLGSTTFEKCPNLTVYCIQGTNAAEFIGKYCNVPMKYEAVDKAVLDNKIDKSSITTILSPLSTDEEIPSAKATFDMVYNSIDAVSSRITTTENDINQINETITTKTNTAVPETLAINTIYDLGEQTSLTLNLPSGQLGDFIQVDFLSTATPTTLTITATSGLSDYDLIPEANTIYSLYFSWIRLDATTYGWGFGYAEYTRTVA